MENMEEFERLVKEQGYFVSMNRTENGYAVAALQEQWEGYQMRQPEIDALKAENELNLAANRGLGRLVDVLQAENEQLRNALKPFAVYAPHYPKQRTYGNRPATGEWHSVESGGLGRAEITVEDFHNAAELINK